MKELRVAGLALIVAACGDISSTNAPVTWGVDVPEPVATHAILARSDASMTLQPASPTGAVIGVGYAYRMPPCGVRGVIDVDGSFWDAIGDLNRLSNYDLSPGTFRLTSRTTARFSTPYDEGFSLERHRGPKEFGFCM